MGIAAANLEYLGAEAREVDHCGPAYDVKFASFRHIRRVLVPILLAALLLLWILPIGAIVWWVHDLHPVAERDQILVDLTVHEQFDGILLEAQSEILQLMQWYLVILLVNDLR